MPQVAAQFQQIFLQTGAAARFASADRIVVQGGLRVPQAIVQVQWLLEWRTTILLPGGQHLDPWVYAHCCEAGGMAAAPMARPGEGYLYLLPPADPDPVTVRRLILCALGTTEEVDRNTSLVSLTTRALMAHHGGRPVTTALVRAATSVAVHAEHASLSAQAGAPLLCALHSVLPVAGAAMAPRFSNAPLFKTLTALSNALTDPREGLALRARGFTAVRETVPDDGAWHPWESVLRPDKAIGPFWNDLCGWIAERRHALGVPAPPAEWLGVAEVMSSILRVCVGPPVECHLLQGLRRFPSTQAAPAVAAAAAAFPPSARPGATEGTTAKARSPSLKESAPAVAAAPAPGPAAAEGEGRVEDGEQLTLVEQVEEVLLSLCGSDPASYVHLGVITQEAQKRTGGSTEKLSKKWYETHRGSFELKKFQHGPGSEDWRVRLAEAARARAAARDHERRAGAQRARELRVAEEVLPKLSADSLPRTLRAPELAGLLSVCGQAASVAQGLPSALLLRLCRSGNASPKELLLDAVPFPPALLMKAIVVLEKQRRERWNKDALDMVLQAAALDMHQVDDRPRAALPTAAAALWAAARQPFSDRLNASKCLLVPSAALRLQLEISEGFALSPDASTFRPFGEMCAWLAHLVVTASLPEEVRGEVLQAFKKLASTCQELGKAPEKAPCDAEGLCRLAMALALVVREERKSFGTEALAGLTKVCVQRAMDDAGDWRPQQLAVLASACCAAEVQSEGLFRKIGVVAERHAKEWTTEHVMKLLQAGSQLGHLKHLDKFLKSLQLNRGLQKCTKEVAPRDLPLLFSVLVFLQDASTMEELMQSQRGKVQDVSMSGLIAILRDWPASLREKGTATSQEFRSAVLREAVGLAGRKAPALQELKVLVEAAKEDAKALARLTELAASPALLGSLPPMDASWQEICDGMAGILGPFNGAGVEVPRLEAACASRLLLASEKTSPDARTFAGAALSLHEAALVAMPALLQALADKLSIARLPRQSSSEVAELRKLCERLVKGAAKTTRIAIRGSGDAELDSWVERLERCVLEDPDHRPGSERRFDSLEQKMAKRVPTIAREALGPNWLGILLLRSRKFTWLGGKTVHLEPPKPRTAVRRLAETAEAVLGKQLKAEADALEHESEKLPEPAHDGKASSGSGAAAGRPSAPPARQPEVSAPSASVKSRQVGTAAAARDAGAAAGTSRGSSSPAANATAGPSAAKPSKLATMPRPPPGALIVCGGYDKAMGETLSGTYMPSDTNHNRAVYRRVDPPNDSCVLLYYWDDRDGEAQSGWWFGPEIGGEEVWAHNTGVPNSALPPQRGWRVLHSGAVDPALTVLKAEAGPTQARQLTTRPAGVAGPTPTQARPPGPSAASQGPSQPAPRPRGSAGMAMGPPPGNFVGEAPPPPRVPPSRPRGPSIGAPAAPAPQVQPARGAKRPRIEEAHAEELRAWLEGLDDGAGAMLQYYDVLANEFDADLAQIAAAKVEGGERQGILGVVDPSFWETVQVEKAGHKMLFARGIAKL